MTTNADAMLDVRAHLERLEVKAAQAGREATQARLDAWRARIEQLRVQAHLAGLDARDDLIAPIERLDARMDHVRDRLHDLAHEADDAWNVLAATYESVRDELTAGARLVEASVAHRS